MAPVLPLEESLEDAQLAGRVLDPSGSAATPFPFAIQELGEAPRLGADTEDLMASVRA